MRKINYALLILLASCSTEEPREIIEPPPPGIASEPRWLTFDCVEPGCETKLSLKVGVLGERSVAIKRIILSDRERTDFVIETEARAPFVMKAGETFAVDVIYRPSGDPRAGDVNLLVTFTDASASEEDESRIPPGELEIPLVRRIIGTAELVVTPGELIFGAARPGETRVLPLTIENMGFGNVGLVIDDVDTGARSIFVANLPESPILPGQSHDVMISYAPVDESYVDGELLVIPADPDKSPAAVRVRATSILHPKITAIPAEGVDFGEVPLGTTHEAKLELGNFGAAPLWISSVQLSGVTGGGNLTVALPNMVATATITPLGLLELTLALNATASGNLDAVLSIVSNDPARPLLELPVRALVTEPRIEVYPPVLDFGSVPRGWTVVKPIEIQNVGYGELSITQVAMILGSSDLFTLRTIPNVPIRLRHGQRIGLEIEFRSEAEAVFAGTLSIDSNDATNPFVEVPINSSGTSCEAGCPIANGAPSCTGGTCEVGTCEPDWFDADGDPSTGCECRETPNEPGAFCADGLFVGTLVDEDGDDAVYSGVLAASDDVDVIRFFGKDEGFDVFGDAYSVRVRLESSDPGVQMCVYRKNTGDHLNECYWDNENCPGNRAYHRDGDAFDGDSADYIVKVFRDPNAASACTPYTVFMSND